MNSSILPVAAFVVFVFVIWLFNCLNILREYERAVVFRLGRLLKKEKGPDLVLIFWPIDKIVKASEKLVMGLRRVPENKSIESHLIASLDSNVQANPRRARCLHRRR